MRISSLLPAALCLGLLSAPAHAIDIRPGFYEAVANFSERFEPELPPEDPPMQDFPSPPTTAPFPEMICIPDDTQGWLQEHLAQMMRRPNAKYSHEVSPDGNIHTHVLENPDEVSPPLLGHTLELEKFPEKRRPLMFRISQTTISWHDELERKKIVSSGQDFQFLSDECSL